MRLISLSCHSDFKTPSNSGIYTEGNVLLPDIYNSWLNVEYIAIHYQLFNALSTVSLELSMGV